MKAFSINIVFLIFSLIGLYFVNKLSLSLEAQSNENTINISYHFAEASAQTIEQEVSSKIEQAANSIRGLKEIKSRSSYGKGEINCTFDQQSSIDYARFEIASSIRRLYPNFPQGVSYPEISLNKPSEEKQNTAFQIYSLYAPDELNSIYQYAQEQIEPKLSSISELSKVQVYGGTEKFVKIAFNNQALKQYQLNTQKLANIINSRFAKQSIGQVNKNQNQSYYLLIDNRPSDTINWQAIPITNYHNKIIYLGEIANISYQQEKEQSYFRINGRNAINIALYPKHNANELALANELENEIIKIRANLPPNYQLVKNYDATQYIKKELTTISYRSLATLGILMVFIFLISLSFRYLLVVLISFVANVLIAIIFYYFFSMQINLYSLAGITISLGLVVDNSIVMIEHYRNEKNRKVFLALLASTLTSIAALSSIFLLDEKIKTQLYDFAGIIIINLFVSLVIALFLIPALLEKIALPTPSKTKQVKKLRKLVQFNQIYLKIILFLRKRKKIVFTLLVLSFGLPIFLLPNKISSQNSLAKAYNNTIGSDFFSEEIKPMLNKTLGGSLRLFYYYVFDNMSFATNKEVVLSVQTSSTKNHTIEHINSVFLNIEQYLSRFREIKSFQTQIISPLSASIVIRFKAEFEKGNFPYQLKNRLIFLASDMDALNWNIHGVGEGFSSYNGDQILKYAIAVYGYNYQELDRQIQILSKKLKTHPRVQTVQTVSSRNWLRSQKPQQKVLLFDNFMLSTKGLSSAQIYQNLFELTQKQYGNGYLFDRGKYIYYKLEDQAAATFDSWKLYNTPLSAKNNSKANFSSTISNMQTEEDVMRENNQYKRIVELEYLGVKKFADQHIDRVVAQMKTQMPLGYSLERIEDNSFYYLKEKESTKYYLLLIVFLLIFVLCTILFESFRQSFIVLSIVPLSFIGLFLAFYLFDIGFDQGGFAAFVMLSGITVNSVLYIINDFNNIKKVSKKDSIFIFIKAFNKKIIPILLTIISTILGLIPFLFFSENTVFWQALAVGSIGGLLASFVVIVFVLPLFFFEKNFSSASSSEKMKNILV